MGTNDILMWLLLSIPVVVALYLLSCIRVLNEYQRGVIFRLGRALPYGDANALSSDSRRSSFGEEFHH